MILLLRTLPPATWRLLILILQGVEMPILLAVKRGPESNGSVHFETDATSIGR
jgi:hypothetical protein